jgi:hypothetical protein
MKTPVETLLENLSSIISINISDAVKYNEIINEAKELEQVHINQAYEDGVDLITNQIETTSQSVWHTNYFKKKYK